jgi:hypothetical protein
MCGRSTLGVTVQAKRTGASLERGARWKEAGAEAAGIDYRELLTRLVDSARDRYR